MGQGKNKNSASRLARFLLFFCQSQLAGIIRAHPSNPWSNPASFRYHQVHSTSHEKNHHPPACRSLCGSSRILCHQATASRTWLCLSSVVKTCAQTPLEQINYMVVEGGSISVKPPQKKTKYIYPKP
jgi:hypothetical protein